jgi:signal transduction histidine kinase
MRLDEFLASASHELRTPLSAILGWVRVLRSRALDGEASARALAAIERNALAEAQVIEDLLDGARIVTGQFQLERAPVDLAVVVRDGVAAAGPIAAGRGIAVLTTLDMTGGRVVGDADRLTRVVLNLIVHAALSTPPGGRVEVALDRADAYVRVTVHAGAGPHLPPGLALEIARRIVELHGGTIEASGTSATSAHVVRLPAG